MLPALAIASPQKVFKEFQNIDHCTIAPHCNFIKLVRRRNSNVKGLFPIENVDYDEKKQIYAILCDHKRCDYNSILEYAFASYVLDGKITREELNSLRPVGWEEESHPEAPNVNQDNIRFGCSNFKVLGLKTLIYEAEWRQCIHEDRVHTAPCTHEGNCSRLHLSIYTLINGIHKKMLPEYFLQFLRFGLARRAQIARLNGISIQAAFENQVNWFDNKYNWNPAKTFIISAERVSEEFYVFNSDGLYRTMPHEAIYDFDSIRLVKDLTIGGKFAQKYIYDIFQSTHPLGIPTEHRKNLPRLDYHSYPMLNLVMTPFK
ncbi:unnamed protein product [Orchesella dallaii]|uniref:Uncharacterized protein n=1 Tax=Orchesella dallaii TaxID=48710 RepID=A0ABP1S349_9HEXA